MLLRLPFCSDGDNIIADVLFVQVDRSLQVGD